MTELTNKQLDVFSLPKIEDLVFQPLEPKYKTVLIIGRVIFLVISAIACGLFIYSAPFDIPERLLYLSIGIYLLYLLWSFIVTIKGFEHKSYALREKDIIYKSGWLWRYVTTAPFNRVQHVRIDQGPVERKFNLAKLRIFTAGGTSSDLTIPGLTPDTANELKDFIVKKTLADEEE